MEFIFIFCEFIIFLPLHILLFTLQFVMYSYSANTALIVNILVWTCIFENEVVKTVLICINIHEHLFVAYDF